MNKVKITDKDLVKYWNEMEEAITIFRLSLYKIEQRMQEKYKNESISFFWSDGDTVGIGTYPFTDEMDLVHDSYILGLMEDEK